jgi:hypothetical protein
MAGRGQWTSWWHQNRGAGRGTPGRPAVTGPPTVLNTRTPPIYPTSKPHDKINPGVDNQQQRRQRNRRRRRPSKEIRKTFPYRKEIATQTDVTFPSRTTPATDKWTSGLRQALEETSGSVLQCPSASESDEEDMVLDTLDLSPWKKPKNDWDWSLESDDDDWGGPGLSLGAHVGLDYIPM